MAVSLVVRPGLMSQGRGALFGNVSNSIPQTRLGCRLLSTAPVSRGNDAPRRDSRGRLQGRACLITGGTSGIGYAIAKRFIEEGVSKVILVGRSETRLEKAAGQLQESFKTNSEIASRAEIVLHVADVGKTGEWPRALETTMADIDILINAAGISHAKILPKTEPDEISQILRTNLDSAILTSRAFMRAALRSRIRKRNDINEATHQRSKCIINVSSLLALKGGTGAVPYAASKAGLLGLTRSLAAEAAASMRDVTIRANAIVPGYIETPMISDFSDGEVARLKNTIPLQRFGTPEEVADATVFLAQNEYANNCVLNLDGGLSAV